jgi:cell division protein FtsB
VTFAKRVKQFLRAAVAPSIFLTLVVYFCWNATQGERGLQSYALRQVQLKAVQAEFQKVEAERDVLERRVAGLRTQRLDSDTLDERARAMLNLAEPNDVVLMYGSGKRLF